MGLFQKFKEGLRKTQEQVSREIKRIFTGSPKLTLESIEELEAALLGGDFGVAVTSQIGRGRKNTSSGPQRRSVLGLLSGSLFPVPSEIRDFIRTTPGTR